MQASIGEHMEIVSALRQGDPERCNQLLCEHVADAHNRLTKTMSVLS
jgi:DNA-binding GntR family transcriptional regulator